MKDREQKHLEIKPEPLPCETCGIKHPHWQECVEAVIERAKSIGLIDRAASAPAHECQWSGPYHLLMLEYDEDIRRDIIHLKQVWACDDCGRLTTKPPRRES